MRDDRMLDRLARYTEAGGEGLGKYVADEFKLQLFPDASETERTLLEPCLVQLERAIERASPVITKPTSEGLMVEYGPVLAAGDIVICAASPLHAATLRLPAPGTNLDRPRLPDRLAPPGAVWWLVGETVDAANGHCSQPQAITLATVLLGQMSVAGFSGLLRFANESRQLRSTLVPAVVAVVAREGNRACGGLLTLLLPRSTITENAV
jgi:hypothetical protein